MGAKQSVDTYDPDDDEEVPEEAEVAAKAKANPFGARLYLFVREKNPPWVLKSLVEPDFVNDADDEESDAPDWYFHVRRYECRCAAAVRGLRQRLWA